MGLSERQQQIMTFITKFSREKGRPPTIREIGSAVGITSTSVVNYNLNVLQKEGLLEREKEVSRGLRLVTVGAKTFSAAASEVIQIPLLGRIVAGKPVPVPEPGSSAFEGDTLTLTREILQETGPLFALHVKGDSMIDALVNDGDIVVMKHQETAANGDMVAVWLKNREETTLKRYYREKGKVRLQPANPKFKPLLVDPEHVQIQGKVVLVIRQLGM
jgi:repressor LexA